MKKYLFLALVLVVMSISGCGADKKDILAGFEKPDTIIATFNKNLEGDNHQLQKIPTEYQTVWRMTSGAQLSFIDNTYNQGVSLLLCYAVENMDANEMGTVLQGILKSLGDGDAVQTIEQLKLSEPVSAEAEYGNFVVQKVSAKNLTIDKNSTETFELPVSYIRIERKPDKKAMKNQETMSGDTATIAGLEELVRRDKQLKEASDYYRHDVKQDNEKPELVELIHFVN